MNEHGLASEFEQFVGQRAMSAGHHLREISFFRTAVIQTLDPIRVDSWVAAIQKANREKDLGFLIQLLSKLTNEASVLDVSSDECALAVMRDLGILLGSLKRHGIEPIAAVPHVESLLVRLGALTGMVPRDTVHHYTSWNPDGPRRRAYTDDIQERALQHAVVQVFPSLSTSLALVEELYTLGPQDARFAPLVDCLNDLTSVMVGAINGVVQDVSPAFFATVLRPYFEDVSIGGNSYLGPAAAQVPLWLVDLCVWASDRRSEGYAKFLASSIVYCLPPWKTHYNKFEKTASLVSKLQLHLTNPLLANDTNVLRSATSVTRLLKTLKTFRGRHLGIARKAYSPNLRQYEHGSGGAPVELLKEIVDLTTSNERLLFARNRDTGAPSDRVEAALS